uniref:acetyltransferase n=1 Tax=Algoriphagus sp. TaxID=1872435 RepID=UPI004047A51D
MSDYKVILVGYSGHGLVLVDTAKENKVNFLGYAELFPLPKNPFGLRYLGNETESDFLGWKEDYSYLLGIGDNHLREMKFDLIKSKAKKVINLFHPSASISSSSSMGEGVFVNRNVSVNAFSKIGSNVILNTGCIIEHECVIDSSVHIAPGAVLAGNVTVGKRSFIGANSVIKQGVIIGNDVIIGAGSVILKSIPDGCRVVGNPGRFL